MGIGPVPASQVALQKAGLIFIDLKRNKSVIDYIDENGKTSQYFV